MPQTPKLSPQQKAALVEKIKAGEISRQAAAQSVGVSNTTVRQWLRIYESEGADGLAPREKSRHLTAEEKQAAVAEYLAGGVSLFDVCKKYGIRSPQNLQKLVEKAQAGGELRGYHGASRHRGGAYTTAADREKIVRECLADGCDYGAAALKYNVDYKALVHWVGQYRAGAALHDPPQQRGHKPRQGPRPHRAADAADGHGAGLSGKPEKLRRYGAEIRDSLPPNLPLGAALSAGRLARHE